MAHVFISYFHEDFEFAENSKQRLEKAGFEVWMDEEKLRAGEDWREEIDEALMNSFALLLVMTPSSLNSRYVAYEWSFAWGAGKKVIPLLRVEVVDDQIHPRLDRRQYLDFTARKGRPWDKLIQRLKEIESVYNNNSRGQGEEKINPTINNLLRDLNHKDFHVRIGAAKVLKQFEDDSTIDGLLNALRDSESRVREEAALSLENKLRDDIPFALLVNLHNDEDIQVRVASAMSLGRIATPEAISGLIDATLNDDDYDVRETCINGLEAIDWSIADDEHDKKYVVSLAELLLNCDEYVEEQSGLRERRSHLRGNDIASAFESMNVALRLKVIAAEIDLCEKVASILQAIGTPEALAAVEDWRSKQQNS